MFLFHYRTPNLQEQCQPREQIVPSLLAMGARQTGGHGLRLSHHPPETAKRRLSLRVLSFNDSGIRTKW